MCLALCLWLFYPVHKPADHHFVVDPVITFSDRHHEKGQGRDFIVFDCIGVLRHLFPLGADKEEGDTVNFSPCFSVASTSSISTLPVDSCPTINFVCKWGSNIAFVKVMFIFVGSLCYWMVYFASRRVFHQMEGREYKGLAQEINNPKNGNVVR